MSEAEENRLTIEREETEPRDDRLDSFHLAPRGRRASPWQSLERVTNVAILVTCAVLVTVVIRGGLTARPSDLPLGPAAGDRLAAIDGLVLAAHDHTLLLVLSSQCRFCTESMPFYRRLLDRREARTQVVVASTESVAVTAAYLASHDVEVDRILEVAPDEIGTTATPTLLELSRSGEILEVMVGRVPDAQVTAVTTRLLSPGR